MNRKGISMVSLVIIVIVIIILVAVTTYTGYRAIENVNAKKAVALEKVIGNAALNRQNDSSSGLSTRFYEGYLFDVESADYSKIENIDKNDFDSDGIPDCLQEEGAYWYVIDADAAKNLGVSNTEDFLTNNISYYLRSDITEDEKSNTIKAVLTDYTSGQSYYVKMPVSILVDSVANAEGACANSPTGTHKFTVPTCTENSKCIYNCGEELNNKLGHDWVGATCTSDGYCKRCGVTNENDLATGHILISDADISDSDLIDLLAKNESHMVANSDDSSKAWIVDANKHWHQCIKCGEKFEEKTHERAYISINDATHKEICDACGWESIVGRHDLVHTQISNDMHKVECRACAYEATHSDSGWQSDHELFHYRFCVDSTACNDLTIVLEAGEKNIIFKEAHYDNNEDYLCDVCGRNLDTSPPWDFEHEEVNSYAKIIKITTGSITIEAFTVDKETQVSYYQFGILNSQGTIEWSEDIVYVSDPSAKGVYTFNNLKDETDYTFYVRAADVNGNINTPYKITGKTSKFPEFKGLKDVPDGVRKGPVIIGVQPIDTTDTNIYVIYKQNTNSWSEKVPVSELNNLKITLTEETENLTFKLVDDAGNESIDYPYVVKCIDNTPPVVTISEKPGDSPAISALNHRAGVTITDALSGIDVNTEVKYGWSTSKTTAPTELFTTHTPNLQPEKTVTFDIITPEGKNGSYYLWIMQGTKDLVGNPTTVDVVSKVAFVIDDEEALITNIKMLNLNPPEIVSGEQLFVKTDGKVTITFTANKSLKSNPMVKVNGVNVNSISRSGRNYTCTITIDSSFEEGTLVLYIGDVISANGKTSNITYSNADLIEGPVYYDKTNPIVEYITKTS